MLRRWQKISILKITKNYVFVTKGKRQAIIRSSQQRRSVKKGVLGNLTKFIGKHPHQRLFFNKFVGFSHATLSKKKLRHWCFPMNFTKLLTPPNDCFSIILTMSYIAYLQILTAKAVWNCLFLIVVF